MRISHRKDVLTTGEVARICHVAPRTVSKWFDTGELRGYRIPGSRDRRIPLEELVSFMQMHGMPLSGLDGGLCRLLLIASVVPPEVLEAALNSGRYEIRVAANGFEAGVLAGQFRPHVVILEVGSDADESVKICQNIKASATFGASKVIAASGNLTEELGRDLTQRGFDGCLPIPYSLAQLTRAVDSVTNLFP